MLRQESLPLMEGLASLVYQHGVLAHLRNGHAGAAQPIHEIEPAEMKLAIDAAASAVSHHTGNQTLRLIPADSVYAASGAGCELPNTKVAGHAPCPPALAVIRQSRAHSRSSNIIDRFQLRLAPEIWRTCSIFCPRYFCRAVNRLRQGDEALLAQYLNPRQTCLA